VVDVDDGIGVVHAAPAGLGRTRRILLSDTLLAGPMAFRAPLRRNLLPPEARERKEPTPEELALTYPPSYKSDPSREAERRPGTD
jgi:hypothetical protein